MHVINSNGIALQKSAYDINPLSSLIGINNPCVSQTKVPTHMNNVRKQLIYQSRQFRLHTSRQ